jgi:hypothetical protein
MKAQLLGLCLVLSAAGVAAAKDATCTDPTASLYGEVIIGIAASGSVQLEWKALEDRSVIEYRLSRREASCGRSSRCDEGVATVRAGGAAGAVATYELIDTPPAGVWTYRLEIARRGGPGCILETTPLFVSSTPSCDVAALCSQVEATFAVAATDPALSLGAASARWLVGGEGGSIASYRLSRGECASEGCWAEVATVSATGACGVAQAHAVTVGGEAASMYRLELLDPSGRPVCTVDHIVR